MSDAAVSPFEPEELESPVPHPDAPCDYGHCMKPWVRRIAGRFMCAQHVDKWKEVVLPSPR